MRVDFVIDEIHVLQSRLEKQAFQVDYFNWNGIIVPITECEKIEIVAIPLRKAGISRERLSLEYYHCI